MKKNYYLINAFACLTLMIFCFGSILLAQPPRRKTVPKRTTSSDAAKRKAENNASVKTESPQNIANPKLQPDAEVAVLETDYGKIVIELYPKLAPQMVERFKKLIKEGFYNGTAFHRTSPSLGIIQGGDPNSKDTDPNNDGYGNSPYPNVPAELSDLPYERGIVGAARASDLDSANSQFFIMLKRQSFFDKKYTVFGKIIEGLTNVYIISISPNVPDTERPEDPVVVRRVILQPRKLFVANK